MQDGKDPELVEAIADNIKAIETKEQRLRDIKAKMDSLGHHTTGCKPHVPAKPPYVDPEASEQHRQDPGPVRKRREYHIHASVNMLTGGTFFAAADVGSGVLLANKQVSCLKYLRHISHLRECFPYILALV